MLGSGHSFIFPNHINFILVSASLIVMRGGGIRGWLVVIVDHAYWGLKLRQLEFEWPAHSFCARRSVATCLGPHTLLLAIILVWTMATLVTGGWLLYRGNARSDVVYNMGTSDTRVRLGAQT